MEKTSLTTVKVAAAVLQRADGSFLLAQRPEGKIWAGYWEFPGGKIEEGETAYHALVRELDEELGIQVTQAYPWVTRVFDYPHARVELKFFRVTAWQGELQAREGQAFSWDTNVSPILPANEPILRALALPDLYAISNIKELGEEVFFQRLEQALARGVRLIQLREKTLSSSEQARIAEKMLTILEPYNAKLLLNGDIELSQRLGAAGVQLSSQQLRSLTTRPEVGLCAASCHDEEELALAEKLACDFILLSPVLATLSHPGAPHLGWEKFARLIERCPIPVFALGGLTMADMALAQEHGAHGISLLRQAW